MLIRPRNSRSALQLVSGNIYEKSKHENYLKRMQRGNMQGVVVSYGGQAVLLVQIVAVKQEHDTFGL